MNLFKMLGAAALMAVLVGCAQAPKKQAFNREAASHIKTVLITQAPNQTSYEAAILGHPGMSFGLIGGLVAAADMQNKSTKLTTAIDPSETRLQERFCAKLKEALTVAGYTPTVVLVDKDAKGDKAIDQAKAKASGDAILNIELIGSYWAAGPSTDYFPRVFAGVKEVDASGAVLYQDIISFGYVTPQAQTIHLASDPQYRFASIDALTADPAKTREGLYSGIDAIVGQIVADLKKN
jgi:hypothetical protein